MRRDFVIVGEMIAAAESAIAIVGKLDATALGKDRLRRDVVLWNMTILGEASAHISERRKTQHPVIPWRLPTGLAIVSCALRPQFQEGNRG